MYKREELEAMDKEQLIRLVVKLEIQRDMEAQSAQDAYNRLRKLRDSILDTTDELGL